MSPEVWADDQVVVTHRPGPGLLGYLFVEPGGTSRASTPSTSPKHAIARAGWVAATRRPCADG
ncbi:hypothetical protein [Amycolatopsis sp. NPDC051128]|uniref:hypothetical protein n=1 Tax=Amycolatopsis sp. NPDC051128 TaxID=3155412 RepID=UPI00342F8FB0